MASLKDIRARIQSTKNTQQITRAVKMVSSAKLRRAQHHIVNLRPYASRIQQVIQNIAATHRVSHPLLEKGGADPQSILVIVFTSDRGLCGAFNNAANRSAWEFYNSKKGTVAKVDIATVGRKGFDFFKRREVMPVQQYPALERTVSLDLAQELSEKVVGDYLEDKYDEVYIVYNEFRSALAQVPRAEKILPLDISAASEEVSGAGFAKDIIFEPAAEVMIDDLLKRHLSYQVYRCMYESVASEHGARMTAMENATKNAQEMIRVLTLTYNKLRQASITTELIEITSGAEALKG